MCAWAGEWEADCYGQKWTRRRQNRRRESRESGTRGVGGVGCLPRASGKGVGGMWLVFFHTQAADTDGLSCVHLRTGTF